MTKRVKLIEPVNGNENGIYFGPKNILFVNTGCTLLNLGISEKGDEGGWPLGRVVNIVGDKSTGKTLLAEEAMANFLKTYSKGKVYYRESEAAFDVSYAQALGLNTSRIDFGPDGEDSHWHTIEEIFDDLTTIMAVRAKKKETQPALYIIDSLDALSSEAELKRDIRKGSYNLDKQKFLGELFRHHVSDFRKAKMCLMFISQTRQRIGPMIRGNKYSRSGGKALDFYASVVIYLSEIGKMYKTVAGVKRATGIRVKFKVEKNKIVTPHATGVFTIRFRYGIDDELSSLEYLEEVKKLKAAGFVKIPEDLSNVNASKLRKDVTKVWLDFERGFTPVKGKYAA